MKRAGLTTTFVLWVLTGVVLAQSPQDQPPVRFGILTAQWQITWEEVRSLWREAEQLGFDSLWLPDHLRPTYPVDPNTPMLESWMLLAALAGETSRVRIGCLVTGNTYRHPAVLAKMATTVDYLSGGRLILGLGAAWDEREHQAYGIPFYTAKERAERLQEAAALIRMLWTETSASFTGKYYQLHNAPFAPKPLQQPYPPILIGGAGRKLILPTVAHYANIWNVGFRTPEAVAELNKILDDYCHKLGRDPKDIERSLYMPLVLTNSSMRSWIGSWMVTAYKWYGALSTRTWPRSEFNPVILGTPAQVTEQIRQYRDAGITTFIFGVAPELGDPHATLCLFAMEVMPAFR